MFFFSLSSFGSMCNGVSSCSQECVRLIDASVASESGVDYGKGRNTPLRISPVPFHDVENCCFTNLEVSGDPAVTSAFFGGLNDFGSDLV